MNDFKRNKHFSEKIANNLKFLNNLQPEWRQHVTIVHQTKDLHEVDYTQLYDFLKYNQAEVNELRAERLARAHDPLALMENSNNPYNTKINHYRLPTLQNVRNQVVQNAVQNPGVQNVRNQNRLIVVSGIANPNANQNGNGNVVAARAEEFRTTIGCSSLKKGTTSLSELEFERVGSEEVIFAVDQSMKKSRTEDDKCYAIDDLDTVIQSATQELLKNNRLNENLEEDIGQHDSKKCDSDSETPIRRIKPINTPPELKDLPSHLEYAYLKGDESCPVIISSKLTKKEKASLQRVLERQKGAIAWKMSGNQGNKPVILLSQILMEENSSVSSNLRTFKSDIGELAEEEIEDKFPDEHLMILKTKLNDEEPWYADYVNYIVEKVVPPEWTPKKKKRFFSQVKNYFWDEPYAFRLCPGNVMRRYVAGSESSKILAHCHSGPTGGTS
ncbi:hypothetical protein Tco_1303984 [Tanacetum coccineum]